MFQTERGDIVFRVPRNVLTNELECVFLTNQFGESEDIFNDAIDRLHMLPLTHIHAFIYSPRSNTMASKLTIDIHKDKAKERLHKIKNIIALKNRAFRENKQPLNVLVEKKKGDFYYGLDQFYNRIRIKSDNDLRAKWVVINHYEVEQDMNYAEI